MELWQIVEKHDQTNMTAAKLAAFKVFRHFCYPCAANVKAITTTTAKIRTP
jgi:Fe2+ transport system protein B